MNSLVFDYGLRMPDYAANLRRLMARSGLTLMEVVHRSGLDERTVKSILSGANSKPHARTLHQLAEGLGVEADELFQNPALLARRYFDRQTNPIVDEVVSAHPQLFDGWSQADFDELYSHFGTGGGLTVEGTLATVEVLNRKREVCHKVALVMESSQAELLYAIVEVFYRRVLVRE